MSEIKSATATVSAVVITVHDTPTTGYFAAIASAWHLIVIGRFETCIFVLKRTSDENAIRNYSVSAVSTLHRRLFPPTPSYFFRICFRFNAPV